jgi:hypothetical protein
VKTGKRIKGTHCLTASRSNYYAGVTDVKGAIAGRRLLFNSREIQTIDCRGFEECRGGLPKDEDPSKSTLETLLEASAFRGVRRARPNGTRRELG